MAQENFMRAIIGAARPLWSVCLIAVLGAARLRAESPAIQIKPPSALMDETVNIYLTGLPARGAVLLKARAHWHGQEWEGHASFVSDQAGNVDVSAQAPVSGTYAGSDPMGLFWSMKPDAPQARPTPHSQPSVWEPRLTRFELEIDGQRVAAAECRRWLARPGVKMREVSASGLRGHLYEPPEPGRHPAIVVLGGSEGGQDDNEAALLSSHGYTTLALAYFGAEGLPDHLADVPLEYFRKAVDWLTAQASVDPSRLGVFGGSKGGELALLLAARFPEFKAIVARSPSHVVWEGIGRKSSSWSYDNAPIPFVPFWRDRVSSGRRANEPVKVRFCFYPDETIRFGLRQRWQKR
jgi:fermentation-respiration switch protein FrsA (DUF1100 family)